MQLQSLRAEAFKSLYDMTATFGAMTVITGPNGSGKTNLVSAMRFLKDVHTFGVEFAVRHAGGFDNIAHRRQRRAKKAVRFGVKVRLDRSDLRRVVVRNPSRAPRRGIDETALELTHMFALKTASQKIDDDFSVVEESLEVRRDDGTLAFACTRASSSVTVTVNDESELAASLYWQLEPFMEAAGEVANADQVGRRGRYGLNDTELALTALRIDLFWEFERFLGALDVYQLSPHTSRLPGVPSPNARLEIHGENLPGAAEGLRKRSSRAWTRVVEAMRVLIPTLEEIDIAFTEDRRLALQFRESGVGRPWSAGEMSDGTIQALAVLIAIFQPGASLLVIEEPENALHPWVLRHLLDICRKANRQILLTTHSPIVIGHVNASDVFLMSISNGRSTINALTHIDPDLTEAITNGSIDTFDLYDSGYFSEAVPRGLGGARA